MKRVRNWKIAMEHVDAIEALDVLKKQQMEGYTGPFAIRHKLTGKFIDQYMPGQTLTSEEVMVHGWLILIPDNDEENRNEKIRKLAKETNCSGKSWEALDNMTNK